VTGICPTTIVGSGSIQAYSSFFRVRIQLLSAILFEQLFFETTYGTIKIYNKKIDIDIKTKAIEREKKKTTM